MEGDDEETTHRIRDIKTWLDEAVPTDLGTALSRAQEVQAALSSVIAARIAEPVNQRLAAMPHQHYQGKTAICRWLNGVLGTLHLGVQCPRTTESGLLICDKGGNPNVGRFQIRVNQTGGERPVTFTTAHLPRFRFGPRASASPDLRRSPRGR